MNKLKLVEQVGYMMGRIHALDAKAQAITARMKDGVDPKLTTEYLLIQCEGLQFMVLASLVNLILRGKPLEEAIDQEIKKITEVGNEGRTEPETAS